MPIETREVKTVEVRYMCDMKGCDGTVNYIGTADKSGLDLTNPNSPKFIHKCSECETAYHLIDKYPTLGYQYVPTEAQAQ